MPTPPQKLMSNIGIAAATIFNMVTYLGSVNG